MKENSNDPIQEKKKFRFGIDDLTGNDEINSNNEYVDTDLHNCSNDLSDLGSRIEEFSHRKFAEKQRSKTYSTYSSTININSNKKGNKLAKYLLLFLFVGIPILEAIFSFIVAIATGIFTGFTDEFKNISFEEDNAYYSDYEEEDYVANFETQKYNINISGERLDNNRMILKIENKNDNMISDVKVQTIFYDGDNKPIAISENNINSLFPNVTNIQQIYEIPQRFERYDFLITKPYNISRPPINYEDVKVEVVGENSSNIKLEVTNNTNQTIDSIEIGVIYYSGEDVVDYSFENVYDLKAGDTEEENIYKYSINNDYDRIDYFINDIYIYE